MAKKVIWSLRAQRDRKEILVYWAERNKSLIYSKKLDRLFRKAINILKRYPKIGKLTDDNQVRIKVVKEYFILYEEIEEHLLILSIWDSRQNPEELNKIID
jgi:plasmid stabilization system protein ParE